MDFFECSDWALYDPVYSFSIEIRFIHSHSQSYPWYLVLVSEFLIPKYGRIWWYSVRNILPDSAKFLIRIVRICPPIRHIIRLHECSDRMFDRGKFHKLFFSIELFGLFVWTKSLQGYGRIFDQGRSLNYLWKTWVVPNFPVMMVEVLKVQFFKNYPRWPFKWRKNEK